MWLWDLRAGRLTCTAEAQRLFGFDSSDPRTPDDPLPGFAPDRRRAFLDLLRAGRPFRFRALHRSPAGRVRHLELEADVAPDADDRPGALIGTVREVPSAPGPDRAGGVARALAGLGGVLDEAPFALCYIDAGRRVRFMNAFGGRLHGRPISDILGRRVWEYMLPGAYDIIDASVQAVLAGETEFEFPFVGVGSRRIKLIYVPRLDRRGKPVGYLSVVLDAPQPEAPRAKARGRAERLSFAVARHDLRQSLGAARLFSDLLSRQTVAPEGRALIDDLRATIDSMQELLSEAPAPVLIPVAPMLQRLAREYAPRAALKNLRLRLHAGADSLRVRPQALERALRNLLENAIAYTDKGGVLLACRRRGAALRLEVWDTGRGLAPAELRAVFRAGRRGASAQGVEGSGLGLASARRLAEAMGMRLEALSRPGRGSVFALVMRDEAGDGASGARGASRQLHGVGGR